MTGILRVSLRSVAAHKARLALSTLAVVLGVTFIAGTLVFSDTINASFTRLFTATAPDVTVTPRLAFTPEVEDLGLVGDIPALPDSAVRTVAGVPGVAAANGDVTVSTTTVVDARNTPIGPTTGAPTLARNWYPSAHSPTLVEGRAPTGPGEIAVDATSAARHDVHLGDPLRVITPTASLPVTVVGLTDLDGPNPGVAMIYLDTPTAQAQLLGKPGQFSAVTVDAAPGTSDTDLRQHLQAALGPHYAISIKEELAQSSAAQISAFLNVVTYALLGFAGIAVVVGIFGILNTFSMLVAARTRELGLLRALGASRRQVTGMVLVEGLLLGLAGATIGLGAGIGLATLLKALISRFGVDLSGTSLVISPLTPAAAYTVGIGVTVLAAYLPARRAARVSPMAALREASAPPVPSLRRRSLAGAVLLAGALAALVAAAAMHADLVTSAVLLAAGVAGSLVAAVVLAPVIAQVVVRVAGAGYPLAFGAVGQLSRRNALRNPRRTGTTAAALMIGSTSSTAKRGCGVVSGRTGCRVAELAGVESEFDLAFVALHQLCRPMLGDLAALPGPQQHALCVAFGLASGKAPDRFLVGLAVLSLLAEVAADRPLVCLIDDAQWLDDASAQVLAFVGRRLLAESVLLLFAVREDADEQHYPALPALSVGGLIDDDARALLGTRCTDQGVSRV